eukprot:CAMPEP_0168510386 /NCGR_PEP_ID=MMETSP0405-20121227/1426_1 /TAXON_ID=498012 /ORGANISM="Trichosphaerium sp, Strain Am-I-7 wt" /LENGTH=415 /DNA_ID=CAMNT_0008528197 /DNA_START=904 /DNA_END=2151 /DNA_ORIENTATION=-
MPNLPMHIYGAESEDSAVLITRILLEMRAIYAFVDSVTQYENKLLFESLLAQILERIQLKYPNQQKTNTATTSYGGGMSRFAKILKEATEPVPNETIFLVVANAKRLYERSSEIYLALGTIGRSIGRDISVIFICNTPHYFHSKSLGDVPESLQIYFPPYSKAAICRKLTQDKTQDPDYVDYRYCIEKCVDVFYPISRSLPELEAICNIVFVKFMAPLRNNQVKREGNYQLKLFKMVQVSIRKILNNLNMQATSLGDQLNRQYTDLPGNTPDFGQELPKHAKYLLIASYLATHNPKGSDERIFGTHNKARRVKGGKYRRARTGTKSKSTGPANFTIERMLAIYKAITQDTQEKRVQFSDAHNLAQVSTLVSLGLLREVDSTNMSKMVYKCRVDLQYIKTLSDSLSFAINSFLNEE